MKEILEKIFGKLNCLEDGQQRLEEGQKRLEARQETLEEGQKRLEARQETLEKGQKGFESRQIKIESRMDNLEEGQKSINVRLDALAAGQKENTDILRAFEHRADVASADIACIREDINYMKGDITRLQNNQKVFTDEIVNKLADITIDVDYLREKFSKNELDIYRILKKAGG